MTTHDLDIFRYRVSMAVAEANLKYTKADVFQDEMNRRLVVSLTRSIPGTKVRHETTKVIRYPATWWDAVKERFCPRLGVRYTEETVVTTIQETTHVCPHLEFDPTHDHVRFCLLGSPP